MSPVRNMLPALLLLLERYKTHDDETVRRLANGLYRRLLYLNGVNLDEQRPADLPTIDRTP